MEREVGGGIGMGNTGKPMAVSFQCMTKFTTNKKKKQAIQEGVINKGFRYCIKVLKGKAIIGRDCNMK